MKSGTPFLFLRNTLQPIQPGLRAHETRVQHESLLILRDRLLLLARLLQNHPEVVVRLGITWPDADSLRELVDGLRNLAGSIEGASEIVVGLDIIGIQHQRLFILRNRFRYPPLLQQRIPQVIVRFGIVGLDPQRCLVLARRFRHLSASGRTRSQDCCELRDNQD